MKVGLGLPSTIPGVTRQQVLDAARIADQGGLDSLWVIDRVVYPNLDPMATLLAAAAVTERVRLGTSILIAPLRNPVLLAKEAATLDVLSGGRLTLGIAVGGRENDYEAVNAGFHLRGKRIVADIRTMRRVWRNEPPVDALDPVGPKPVQQPIPIWMGGYTPKTIRRAAKYGDGFIVGGGGADAAKQMIASFRQDCAAEGRRGTLPTAALAYFCVAASRDQAREQAKSYLHHYYGVGPDSQFDPLDTALLGTAEEVAEQAKAFQGSGTDLLILFPCKPDQAQAEAAAGTIRERLG